MRRHDIDVVLVNPGNRSEAYQELGDTLAAIEPPVWAGLIASFIRAKGFSVAIVDANAEGLTPLEISRAIYDANPLLVVVVVYGHHPSASTQNMPSVRRICRAIRETDPTIRIALLGGHVAALPERTLEEEETDYVCDGEGLYTILDLLTLFHEDGHNVEKVRGLWYRKDGKICRTEAAPLVMDLDGEMPGVAWDLLPMKRYRAHNWHCFGNISRQPYGSLYTTLGCPFNCHFCCIQAPFRSGERVLGMKKNSYRLWRPESVVSQIETLVSLYNVRNIKFADELFVLNRRHVEGICDLLIERGFDLNIWAYARVDTLNKAILEKLRMAGVRWLALGIESASERVRNDSQKGVDNSKIYKAVNEIRGQDINIIGNYIFGLPEDDLETMNETLDMALSLNCEFANFYCAMAYPGSKLYERALKNGWPLPDSWGGYAQHSYDTVPLPTKYLPPREVLRFRDEAFHRYFTDSGYLAMIERKFGISTVREIEEMTKRRLKRRLLE
ncbi:MAG: B12-binding domain-containing radical SAM protein [Syntrophales bacterium]|nr:B12-binding domain-containing radical SAM protein [Syntrophales bacterium]